VAYKRQVLVKAFGRTGIPLPIPKSLIIIEAGGDRMLVRTYRTGGTKHRLLESRFETEGIAAKVSGARYGISVQQCRPIRSPVVSPVSVSTVGSASLANRKRAMSPLTCSPQQHDGLRNAVNSALEF